ANVSKSKGDKSQTTSAERSKESQILGSRTRPAVPTGVEEYFLTNNQTVAEAFKASGQAQAKPGKSKGIIYHPILLAQADIRYLQRKYKLDHEEKVSALVVDPDRRGAVRWENSLSKAIDHNHADRNPAADAQFGNLEAPLTDKKTITALENDFIDWAYHDKAVTLLSNPTLKLFSSPGETKGQFLKNASEEVREKLEEELEELAEVFKKKRKSLQTKIDKEKRELEEDQSEHTQRKWEELGTLAENLFTKSRSRRRISSSLTKRRMTAKAKSDIEESEDVLEELATDMEELVEDTSDAKEELEEKWAEIANEIEEIKINPLKKDILMDMFGVAWMPYHIVEVNGKVIELPGYKA
ncbi:MAG: hypothetical protein N2D54_10630, partial [Chloroflexota bacterium]